jgi:mannose-6-phosphate isomerase-like protein (cupin superfamily)
VQRELGSTNVYFHELTIPPGTVEGTHRHIGSEELYYIFEGEGIASMGDGATPR